MSKTALLVVCIVLLIGYHCMQWCQCVHCVVSWVPLYAVVSVCALCAVMSQSLMEEAVGIQAGS